MNWVEQFEGLQFLSPEPVNTLREFRHFVLSAFSTRFTDLFQVIGEVAFKRIDLRLAQKLLELSNG